jgi:hypothetical protein
LEETVSHELTIENSLSIAVDIYCKLTKAGVTYQRQSLLNEERRQLKTFIIEAQPEITCSISKDPYPGWKPPGNYHHRRSRR